MTAKEPSKLDRILAEARRNAKEREQSYREQALKIYPWICGRCGREFTHANLRELTVHHRDHNHDNNPPDGRNWELLCVYCHDNEHQRQLEAAGGGSNTAGDRRVATHSPFANLKELLDRKKQPRSSASLAVAILFPNDCDRIVFDFSQRTLLSLGGMLTHVRAPKRPIYST